MTELLDLSDQLIVPMWRASRSAPACSLLPEPPRGVKSLSAAARVDPPRRACMLNLHLESPRRAPAQSSLVALHQRAT